MGKHAFLNILGWATALYGPLGRARGDVRARCLPYALASVGTWPRLDRLCGWRVADGYLNLGQAVGQSVPDVWPDYGDLFRDEDVRGVEDEAVVLDPRLQWSDVGGQPVGIVVGEKLFLDGLPEVFGLHCGVVLGEQTVDKFVTH